MAFPMNKAHYNGIKGENRVAYTISKYYSKDYYDNKDILNLYPEIESKLGSIGCVVCIHAGGPKQKADALLICSNKDDTRLIAYTISIKSLNTTRSTFDILNTTINHFNNEFNVFGESRIKGFYDWLDSKKHIAKTRDDVKKYIQNEFDKKCSELLDLINNNNKCYIFMDLIKNELLKTDFLLIAKTYNCKSKEGNDSTVVGECFCSRTADIELIQKEFDRDSVFFISDDAISSRRLIIRSKDGEYIKTPFRIRITSNNGLSAYYGLNPKNKNSYVIIKIQVDSADYYLKQMKIKFKAFSVK